MTESLNHKSTSTCMFLTSQSVIVKKLNGICQPKSWHPHLHPRWVGWPPSRPVVNKSGANGHAHSCQSSLGRNFLSCNSNNILKRLKNIVLPPVLTALDPSGRLKAVQKKRLWIKGQSVLPNVINPAVYTYRHEHVEVDPQGEPVIAFLVAQPVDQCRLVYLSLQTVPQVPWNCTHTHRHIITDWVSHIAR